jgi:3-keto-5-aminohexanoate cleavage enzyme
VNPLIITATPNVSWLNPGVAYPGTPEQMAAEAKRCEDAGAAILHMHAEEWVTTIRAVRSATALIVQCGMSSLPIPERDEVFTEKADMISIIVSHHDEAFADGDTHALHPREELEEYARLSREHGVKLEFEVWHTGSIWNLRYLLERGLLDPPHFTSLFFGWPGGTWSPPTIEEYLYRRSQLPPDCVATISVMGGERRELLAAASGPRITLST